MSVDQQISYGAHRVYFTALDNTGQSETGPRHVSEHSVDEPAAVRHHTVMYRLKLSLLTLLTLLTLSLVAACGADDTGPPTSKCEGVVCAEYEMCSEDDGLCHCGATHGDVCTDDAMCLSAECVSSVCTSDADTWSPGQPIYREATSDWGLDGVQGTRLSSVDFDADGWTDLVVRRGGNRQDDFSPEGTRHTWLLRNTGEGGFEDVTEASGFLGSRENLGGDLGRPIEVVAWGDVNNDGLLDVFTGADTTSDAILGATSELLINAGGVFQFTAAQSAIQDLVWPAGVSFVDVDRDGNLDLWVAQNAPITPSGTLLLLQDRLLRGDGAGGVVDATDELGLTTVDWANTADISDGLAHSRAWSSTACDLNGDGNPELLAASYGRAPNHLWRATVADGSLTYANESVASGYARDENEAWYDNHNAACYCRNNPSAEGCDLTISPQINCSSPNWRHETDRQPYRLGGISGTTICGDVDNDGDLDLLTTELKHWWAGSSADGSELLINNSEEAGAVRFERPGRSTYGIEVPHYDRVSWDEGHITAGMFDFDNDGRLDVLIAGSEYAGNHALLYHQQGGEQLMFERVASTDGIDHNRALGLAVADFDRDGDLDLVLGHSRARCDADLPNDCYETTQVRLFENTFGDNTNWVQIRLDGGNASNRAAIGARVMVSTDAITQTHEVGGGHGHFGIQHDLVQHFGLGSACEASVTIRWPDADLTEQTVQLPAGHRYLVVQGEEPSIEQ